MAANNQTPFFPHSKKAVAPRADSQACKRKALGRGWKETNPPFQAAHQELPFLICSFLPSEDNTGIFLSLKNHFHDQDYH